MLAHDKVCVSLVCVSAPPGPCESDPCQNGGTCESTEEGGFECVCEEGWTGDVCDVGKLIFMVLCRMLFGIVKYKFGD